MSDYPEVELIGRLITLAGRFGLEEIEVEEQGLRVRLRAFPSTGAPEEEPAANGGAYLWPPLLWREPETRAAPAPGRPETARPLTAPLTGTFYRAADPAAPPLVEVGDPVEEGQRVGLIEAMKVFSDIAADRAGVVVEIVAQNGQLVQHGDVLLYVDSMIAT